MTPGKHPIGDSGAEHLDSNWEPFQASSSGVTGEAFKMGEIASNSQQSGHCPLFGQVQQTHKDFEGLSGLLIILHPD